MLVSQIISLHWLLTVMAPETTRDDCAGQNDLDRDPDKISGITAILRSPRRSGITGRRQQAEVRLLAQTCR
ncbi:hypothetical protein B0H19DRAFT_1154304 [Mycena capillaripes]|nr:hypothetical protein B0H19DRAFT_1154304 [Mycena capillaripes]